VGGKRNQFLFLNDPGKFFGEHDVKSLPNGNITLYDDGTEGIPFHPAKAKEYKLNEKKLTANLVWNFCNNPTDYSNGMGSVQRLKNGNTVVCYGRSNTMQAMFSVVNPKNEKNFEIAFTDTLRSYRVYFYDKLPWKLHRPEISCYRENDQLYLDAGGGYKSYKWSTGENTQKIRINAPGTYFVFVPIGTEGFISSVDYTIKDISDCSNHISE
jgi:hypothetical protein